MSHVLVCCSFTIQLDKDRVPLGGKFQRKKQGKTAPPKKWQAKLRESFFSRKQHTTGIR